MRDRDKLRIFGTTNIQPSVTTNNISNYFSIVIPTMWMSNKLYSMLIKYEKCEYIKEVIIIDNDPDHTMDLTEFTKIRYYSKGKNIFVNPAWNWGYSLSKYNLILANDDILIHNLDDVMRLISQMKYDIIGISTEKEVNNTTLRIESISQFPQKNYGCFLYVKNYVYIPDQIKIWYGDDILFNVNEKKGIIKGLNFEFEKSKTINSNIDYYRNTIGKNDIKIYESLHNSSNNLNIIIRTSGRPQFFKRCINSIKTNCKNFKLHITIDNEEDLKYVIKYCDGLNYDYYLIDKKIVEEICKKIKIERNLFIYNYYFNVVKQFLNGWCLYLDDDDELLITPEFLNDTNNIYLHKVDIGIKIVPSSHNFGRKPVLNDISGLGIIFHSSQMIDWKPQRGGDYEFISNLFEKYNSVWVDRVLSKTQIGGNWGKRNDIKNMMISVNMATFPERKDAFINSINNLLNIKIIDTIRIYLNEYDSIPKEFPINDRVIYVIGKENLKDSGKFYWAGSNKDEYYFSVDDDLIYPESYFIDHLISLNKYNNEIFVTLHGKEMQINPIAFNDNVKSYHCLRTVNNDVWINNGGTGVMAFDNSKFAIPTNIFKYHGMADLWIALYCQRNKIPILCRKHHSHELTYLLNNNDNTLFKMRSELKDSHEKILRSIGTWKLYKK